MRLNHPCDSMNLTGCTEYHQWESSLTGIKHLIVSHQIECGLILGGILITIYLYFLLRHIRKGFTTQKCNSGNNHKTGKCISCGENKELVIGFCPSKCADCGMKIINQDICSPKTKIARKVE